MPKQRRSVDWDACLKELAAGAQALKLRLAPAARAAMIDYLKMLELWNATHNLTAVRDPHAMVTRHLLDSLAVLDFVTGDRLVDVGSGPGLPGLVLAIARPKLQVTLVEANGKKAAFLRHVRRRLQLANVTVVQQRVEGWSPEGRFDCVVCRAFAAAAECARLTGHLVAPDGRLLLMKGRDPGAELADLPPDFRAVDRVVLTVPGLEAERHLAILEPGLI